MVSPTLPLRLLFTAPPAPPTRLAGFETAPIEIGDGVWVGCKATILRGVRVGDGAVIGAHALVRSNISDGMLAVGLPAKAVRCLRNTA